MAVTVVEHMALPVLYSSIQSVSGYRVAVVGRYTKDNWPYVHDCYHTSLIVELEWRTIGVCASLCVPNTQDQFSHRRRYLHEYVLFVRGQASLTSYIAAEGDVIAAWLDSCAW